MNRKFINALERRPQPTPPIWFMRQAGRYHSHYQGMRSKNSFDQLCRQPELAAEVALGPIRDFDFDVSILFSDILYPLDAVGLGLSYSDQGPKLEKQVRDLADIRAFKPVEEAFAQLSFQGEALRATRELLPKDKSLIGFIGGLWTLFVYSIEGGHSGSLVESKKRAPLFPEFLKVFEPLMEANIRMHLDNGAEVVMIFDTAAGEVSPAFFRQYLAPALLRFAGRFPGRLGYYSKGTQAAFFDEAFVSAPWAGRGFDHRWDITRALKDTKKGFVQGNFDQGLLHMEAGDFDRALDLYLEPLAEMTTEERAGWVCGLGHGVLPKTPERNVRRFVDRVREVLK
ncbi:MAG: uroporphyrinogen decarboxylase [Bdellovibrionaceae bacterium]|nr:uroporphyrinogen decarboxylase [Pseudobdellovibrionaceae bacterium]